MRTLRSVSARQGRFGTISLLLSMALLSPLAGQEGKDAGNEETPDPQASDKVKPEGKAEEKTPVFKGAKGDEAFKKGRELFDSEKYKEAQVELKKAKDQGKTAGDKELVQTWLAACEGGATLENYRRESQRGDLSRLYFYVVESAEKYRSSPIGPKFAAFTEELGAKALVVLENFDIPTNRYSEKFGKRFISDPKIVFRGPHCVEWSTPKDGKGSQLRVKEEVVPDKWTGFQSIAFWVRWERPVDLQLLIVGPGEGNVLEYKHSPKGSGRGTWESVRVNLDQFKAHGAGTLTKVEGFMIQIAEKATYKFDIDEIVLVRKDKAEAAAADSKDSQDKKQKKQKKQSAAGPAKQTQRK